MGGTCPAWWHLLRRCSIGFSLLLALLLYKLTAVLGSGSARTAVFLSVVVLVAGVYAARAVQHNEGGFAFRVACHSHLPDWVDEKTLFGAAVQALPNNCRMVYNYATLLDDKTVWLRPPIRRPSCAAI